jgi:integrase
MGHTPSYTPVMRAKYYQRKDRSDRWIVSLYWKGKRYYRTFYDHIEPISSERLALRIAEQINGDLENCLKESIPFEPRKWFAPSIAEGAFKNYAEKWLTGQTHYAPSHIRDVNRHIYAAIEFFKLTPIREIRAGHIEDFAKGLPDHLSDKTRKNYLITLHKLFSDAYRREDIPKIPPFPVVSIPEPETRWLTIEDQDRVFEKLPKHDLPIFWFMRIYACRPGEARALQWDCIDFEKGVVILKRTFSANVLREQTKARNIRYLPLVEPVLSILREIRGISGFVFRNQSGRYYQADIGKIWNRACDEAGVNRVCLYQGTRHSWASQKASAGESLRIIGRVLGHSKPEITERYAKISMDGLKGILE